MSWFKSTDGQEIFLGLGDIYYNDKTKTEHRIIDGKIDYQHIYTKEEQEQDLQKMLKESKERNKEITNER
jgi:hypothetical protein